MSFLGGLLLQFVLFLAAPVNAQTILDVNFISQVPPGVWDFTLNCGQTSYLMIDSEIKGYDPTSEMIKDIDDWLYNTYGDPINDYSGSVTNVNKLKNLAVKYGNYSDDDDLVVSVDGDLEKLKSRIDDGDLIIVAVYTHMRQRPKPRGHFMVVTGYDDEYFYFNDPGKSSGKDNKYSTEIFVDSWSRQNYSHLIFKANAQVETQDIVQEEVESEQPPQPNPQPQPSQTERTSLFSRVKNFFANIFTRAPADEVEGEVSSDQEQTQDEVVKSEPFAETDTTPTYDASLFATAPITIAPSDREVLVTVQARNTGNQDWLQSQVSLNVVGGRAANAPYRHSSWLTDLRPTRLDQSRVAPGDVGTFTTLIRVPEGSGDFTFRTQLVRQTGSQFIQLGSGFAAVDIQIGDGPVVPEVAGEQVSSDGSDVPSRGITRQIRETIERVTREVGDTIGDAVEQLGETTRRIFFGGGGSTSNNSTEAEDSAVLDPPTILITAPTTSPYSATTSSIEISGTMNDVVQSMSASTTASGTLSFSTTSLTWQWIGMLDAGTTTISISAASSEQTTSTELVVYYAPTYQLDAPVVVQPTTSSIWYTNATSTRISGTVDDRATQLRVASSSIAVVSSTWEYTPSTTEEGEYPYEFVARDVFENISSSTVFTVVYDITPPTIVTSSFELTSTTLAYTAVATDTLSGVAMYEWHVRSAGPGDIGTCTETTSTVALVDMSSTSSCQWGTLSRELASSTVALPDIVQSQDLVIRWRAIDRAGNSTDWEYHALAYELAQAEEEMPPVLITEIGWMGTVSSTADEWIEIMYTSSSIDIHHWWLVWGDYDAESGTYENEFEITVPGAPPDLPLALPLGYPILFERTDDTTVSNYMTPFIYTGALGNDGEYIALLDSERTIVDEIDARSGWFAGDNATKASMMRRSLVGDSNDPTVWCTYTDCSSDDPLWEVADKEDAGGNTILGTPGGPITGGPDVQQ